ncbi:MAG: beta strand repeat-containing protein, partial [Pseudorhodobacter sp.]
AGTLAAVDNQTGTFTNEAGGTAGAVTNAGTGSNAGTIASLANSGSFDNTGTVGGDATVTDGTLTHSGAIGGGLSITGGTVDVAGGSVTGTTDVSNAMLNINGGSFTGDVTNGNGGTLTATGLVSANIFNEATMTVLAPASLNLTGTITNRATGTLTSTGTLATSGGITNNGLFNAQGALNSNVTNNLTFNVTGPLTATGQSFTNAATGTLNMAGQSYTGLGVLTNDGIANVAGGTLGAGTIDNRNLFNGAGATINGAFLNSGTADLSGGTITGSFTNSNTANLSGATVNGPASNSQDLTLSGGAVTGTLTNTGAVTAFGATSVGSLANSGTVSLLGAGTGDVLSVTNNLSGGGTYLMNSDLTVGAADIINVGGTATGPLTFAFTNTGQTSLAAIPVMTGVAAGTTLSFSGLPDSGVFIYGLQQTGDTVEIRGQLSPGFGGIAANASQVQSLIATVINRPTSPFVSGLAAEEGCSRGGYLRGTFGRSTISGTSNNSFSDQTTSLDATYGGAQGGYDFGCNDGRYFNGWDGSFGAMVGYNFGTSKQDVNPSGNLVTSQTKTKFDQSYVGVYAALSKDRITTDAQLRFESTTFKLSEVVSPGFVGLGLDGVSTKFKTNSVNFTGRLSYRMDMGQEGLSFVPTVGLSYTRTGSARLTFTGGQTLDIAAFDSITGFLGGTIARTTIAPTGDAGTTYFASANYYHDFAGDRKSVFTFVDPGDGLTKTQNISSQNIGGFGELSVGINYVRILENGPAGAKQLNANVRLDGRFGKNVKNAASLTAQVRLSF